MSSVCIVTPCAESSLCVRPELFWPHQSLGCTVAGRKHGFRTPSAVIATTGTIGFMMDCDTTGIEPDLALISTRSWLAAAIKIINNTVPQAMMKLHAQNGPAYRCVYR